VCVWALKEKQVFKLNIKDFELTTIIPKHYKTKTYKQICPFKHS